MCNTVIYPLLPHHHHQHGVQQGPHRKSYRVRELVRIDLLPPPQAMGYSSKTPPSGAGTPARSNLNPTPTPSLSHPVYNNPVYRSSDAYLAKFGPGPSTVQAAASLSRHTPARSSPATDDQASSAGGPEGAARKCRPDGLLRLVDSVHPRQD